MQQNWWVQQNNLMYAGLIGVGVVIVQPFLTAASLSPAAAVCVVAFAVAIPLLAILLMLGQLESQHQVAFLSNVVGVARLLAVLGSCVGVVAAFWHILWIAGLVVLISGFVGLGVYTMGYMNLERATQQGEGTPT